MFKAGDHFIWVSAKEANIVLEVLDDDHLGLVCFNSASYGNTYLSFAFIRRCSRLEYTLLKEEPI